MSNQLLSLLFVYVLVVFVTFWNSNWEEDQLALWVCISAFITIIPIIIELGKRYERWEKRENIREEQSKRAQEILDTAQKERHNYLMETDAVYAHEFDKKVQADWERKEMYWGVIKGFLKMIVLAVGITYVLSLNVQVLLALIFLALVWIATSRQS